MLAWSNIPDVSYCNPVVFSSKANSGSEQENRSFYKAVTIDGDELTHSENPSSPLDWLYHWVQITDEVLDTPQVPSEACAVTTSLVFSAWRHMFISYPLSSPLSTWHS